VRRTRNGRGGDDAAGHPTVEQTYPAIARWVASYGWIELGHDGSRSVVRALDVGGMIWEGEPTYPTLDDALRALEAALAQWLREQCSEERGGSR
jgi:hypothetical protein